MAINFLRKRRRELAAQVRQVAVDAISSHRELLPDTWEVLAQTFQHDTNLECRENALQGLALADADGARALVHAAFTSPDERARAAAISIRRRRQDPQGRDGRRSTWAARFPRALSAKGGNGGRIVQTVLIRWISNQSDHP